MDGLKKLLDLNRSITGLKATTYFFPEGVVPALVVQEWEKLKNAITRKEGTVMSIKFVSKLNNKQQKGTR